MLVDLLSTLQNSILVQATLVYFAAYPIVTSVAWKRIEFCNVESRSTSITRPVRQPLRSRLRWGRRWRLRDDAAPA